MSKKINNEELNNVSGGVCGDKYYCSIHALNANGIMILSVALDPCGSRAEAQNESDAKVKEIFATHSDVVCCQVLEYLNEILINTKRYNR